MKKRNFVRHVQEVVNIDRPLWEQYTQKEIDEILTAMIKVIKDLVSSGNKIAIKGFGIFWLKKIKGRSVVPPRQKRTFVTEDRYQPSFKPSSSWKSDLKVILEKDEEFYDDE